MRKYIKTIILAFLPILCSSCVCSSNCLNYDDFDDFYFTKWIRNDGEFCYFAEGSGRPHYGFGYYENDKTRYRVNMITMLSNFVMRIRENDVDEEYALTKVLSESGDWDGVIKAYDSSKDEEYFFTPSSIVESDLNINNFQTTNLISTDTTISFIYQGKVYMTRKIYGFGHIMSTIAP